MSAKGVDVWVAGTMEKVFTCSEAPSELKSSASLSAARDEHEAFQVVVRPTEGQELSVQRLEIGDLKSDAGSISANNITARTVGYVKVSTPSHKETETGMFPDPLMPFEPLVIKDTRAFWIDVKVPKDAPAGEYRSSVKVISAGSEVLAEVPLTVRVWDFALPSDPPTLVNAWGLYDKPFRRYYDDNFDEMMQKFKENLWDHRITHLAYPATDIPLPKISVADDGSVSINYTEFDAAVADNITHGMNALEIPVPGKWENKEKLVKWEYPMETVANIMANYEQHLKEKGWLEMSYTFLIDEPGPAAMQTVREVHDFLKKAAPGLKRRCDFGYGATGKFGPGEEVVARYREMAGYIEIWCPHIDCVDYEFLAERQKKGEEAWWYICCSASHPYPNCLIDYPWIDSRVPFWMLWKYGVTGYAYWTVNWWLEEPFNCFEDAVVMGKANGDGLMIYPGKDGPIDSVRWELTRDGIEDYEYFVVLSRLVDKAKQKGVSGEALKSAEEALAGLDEVVQSAIEYTKDPALLTAARDRLGEAIEALQQELA